MLLDLPVAGVESVVEHCHGQPGVDGTTLAGEATVESRKGFLLR